MLPYKADLSEEINCLPDEVMKEFQHKPSGNGAGNGVSANHQYPPLPAGMPSLTEMAQQVRPSKITENKNPRSRFQMPCPVPGHESDSERDGGSFFINDTETMFHCFGCDASGGAYKLYQLLFGKPYPSAAPHRTIEEPWSADDWEALTAEMAESGKDVAINLIATSFPAGSQEETDDFSIAEMQSAWRGKSAQAHISEWMDRLIASMRGAGDDVGADRLQGCGERFYRYECQRTKEHFTKPEHCRELGCPRDKGDSLWRFLMQKQRILELMQEPQLHRIDTGPWIIPGETDDEKRESIDARISEISRLLAKLKKEKGKTWKTAYSSFNGDCFEIAGNTLHIILTLVAEKENASVPDLFKGFFEANGCTGVKLKTYAPQGLKHLVNLFVDFLITPIKYDTYENYLLVASAMKGHRLVEGRGDFYKVSGSKPSKSKSGGTKTAPCKCCGDCVPQLVGMFLTKEYDHRTYISDFTNGPVHQCNPIGQEWPPKPNFFRERGDYSGHERSAAA